MKYTHILSSFIVLVAFSACTKSSPKTFACERYEKFECEIEKNPSDCNEARSFLAAEQNTSNPLGAETAGTTCRQEMARLDAYVQAHGFRTAEEAAARKPAGQ